VRVDIFDFDLPASRIALRPAVPRDAARMLRVSPQTDSPLTDQRISDLPGFIQPGDVLVINNTRVISAFLTGVRVRDGVRARVTVNLHKRLSGNVWRAFARPARKLRGGDRLILGGQGDACLAGVLDASVSDTGGQGEVTLAFDLTGPSLDEAIEFAGAPPLPPYIASRRGIDGQDREDYQTRFAEVEGAVAAPTAGLHFTTGLIEHIRQAGAQIVPVTLHVGAGTFLPVSARDTADHKMHEEWGEISAGAAAAINAARHAGGRVIAIGTTSLRLLEAAAGDDGAVRAFSGETDLFITPGYGFRVIDLLVTNFHLPRSTLFMLVSAFSGLDVMQKAYAHAIATGYRFYSYGDSCLLERAR